MNILRHVSPDNRYLYNVKYHDDGSIDTLGIHICFEDRWSPPIPLCHFSSKEIDSIRGMCETIIARVVGGGDTG
jgi:hypothetical protein